MLLLLLLLKFKLKLFCSHHKLILSSICSYIQRLAQLLAVMCGCRDGRKCVEVFLQLELLQNVPEIGVAIFSVEPAMLRCCATRAVICLAEIGVVTDDTTGS